MQLKNQRQNQTLSLKFRLQLKLENCLQKVRRKVLELGLVVTDQTYATANKFIRPLFSLPFMPADAIEPLVYNIQALDTHTTPMAPPLRKLIDYIQDNWVHTTKWPTSNWSVYNRSIRTNNDCKGWHRRVNSKVRRHHLPFYQLVEFLHQEATLVTLQAQLVTENKLKRGQRSRFKSNRGRYLTCGTDTKPKNLM